MESDRLKKAKRAVARLNWEEFKAIEKYFSLKRDALWKTHRAKRIKAKEDEIRSLSPGTKVVYTDTRYAWGGKIGTIVRHLGSGSRRTIVDFDAATRGYRRWRMPSRDLSADVSTENIKRLMLNKNLGTIMTGVLNKIASK